MGFMQRQVTIKQRWLKVETKHGTEFINVYDTGFDWPNSEGLTNAALASSLEQLRDYCDGEPLSWENIEGYGARLSAPGYLDCTEWTVFDSVDEANAYLNENFPEDEDEEEEE